MRTSIRKSRLIRMAQSTLLLTAFAGAVLVLGEEGAGWYSGGGDPLRDDFYSGKKLAVEIIRRLDRESLKRAKGGSDMDREAAEWFADNREDLIRDIEKMELNWDGKSPEDGSELTSCARTLLQSAAEVHLSFDECAGITSQEEAAKLLIHESVHHFGVREETLADAVAYNVFAAWTRMRRTEVVKCAVVDSVVAQNLEGTWVPDTMLTERLGGDFRGHPDATLTIKVDEKVMRKFNTAGRCVQLAGQMILKNRHGDLIRRNPFVLIDFKGNPVVEVPAKDEEERGQTFGHYVMITKAKDSRNDMLLLGRKQSNEALSVYSRAGNDGNRPSRPGHPPRDR